MVVTASSTNEAVDDLKLQEGLAKAYAVIKASDSHDCDRLNRADRSSKLAICTAGTELVLV
jgi:hypothetical protein